MENIKIDKDEPIFSISGAAKLLNISVHTLRMYEREGLFLPYKKESNQRLYSKSDIERIECLRNAINTSKISINGIKAIYSMIPCWEIINCSAKDKHKCKAYNGIHEPCWTYDQSATACTDKKCRECEVYKKYSDCGKVKQLIKTLSKS